MTLVIAGYNQSFNLRSSTQNIEHHRSTEYRIDEWEPKSSGIFVMADSTISDGGNKTILGEFRKIYSVPIKLWKPSFRADLFSGYNSTFIELQCFLAFAGNTLTAQHLMNFVSNHLSKLRISCADVAGPIDYKVLMHCEKNPLLNPNMYWGDDTFYTQAYSALLTADRLAEVISHSLTVALSSARKYKLSSVEFEKLQTEFVAGIRCPTSNEFKLFKFTYHLETVDGIFQPKFKTSYVRPDEIAVLGLSDEFESRAKMVYNLAIREKKSAAAELFKFLNTAISEKSEKGLFDIDRPSYLYELDHELKLLAIQQ